MRSMDKAIIVEESKSPTGDWLKQVDPAEYHRVQFAFRDLMIHVICNSHQLSHFAASFIDEQAKRSVVESFVLNFFSISNQVNVKSIPNKVRHGTSDFHLQFEALGRGTQEELSVIPGYTPQPQVIAGATYSVVATNSRPQWPHKSCTQAGPFRIRSLKSRSQP